jgi:RimJ/RimL family protein N-acetyltransferase
MINLIIETERLNIRPISTDDAPFIFDLLTSESWIKNIGDRGVKTVEDASKIIQERYINHNQADGLGVYAVVLKTENRTIGMCTLMKKLYLDNVDIGYAFLDSYNGKGYALEATKAVYEYAKTDLGMSRIVAATLESNERSQNLLIKLGFHFEKKIIEAGEELMIFADVCPPSVFSIVAANLFAD